MSLTNTDTLTAGFPLVIPTQSQLPTARLVVRNKLGQVVQQWLVKQNKCTLGSASSCSLRCELEGVAPYHALLVIGARQIFIRALAPKLTRDGRVFNEILLTDEESHFEIAGHRFELSRSGAILRTAAESEKAKPERLKFTLARPFELSSRKSLSQLPMADSPVKSEEKSSNAANHDSKWVAQLIQAAVQPLECQLHNLIDPLTELQSESRRKRRLDKKRKAKKRRQATVLSSVDIAAKPEHSLEVATQFENLAVKQSAAMETLTERISDINQQLNAIERIIAEERDRSPVVAVAAEAPQLTRQSLAIDQLQAAMATIATAMEQLQSGQSQVRHEDGRWRSAVQDKLTGLAQVFDSLTSNLASIHQTIDRQALSERPVVNPVADSAWKTEAREQLTGIAQVVSRLTSNIAAVQETTIKQEQLERLVVNPVEDSRWKSEVREQLAGIAQVVNVLTSNVAAVQQTAVNLEGLERPVVNPLDNSPWQSEVREQLASIAQVVNVLTSNVAAVQQTAVNLVGLERPVVNPLDNSPWQSEVREQLAGIAQVVNALSSSVAAVHETAIKQAEIERTTVNSIEDTRWQSEVREQLTGIAQVINTLTSSVAAVHAMAAYQTAPERPAAMSSDDQAWKASIQQQLQELTQVIDGLSASVTQSHSYVDQERTFDRPDPFHESARQDGNAFWPQGSEFVSELDSSSDNQAGWPAVTPLQAVGPETQADFSVHQFPGFEDEFKFANDSVEDLVADQRQLEADAQLQDERSHPSMGEQPLDEQEKATWTDDSHAPVFADDFAYDQPATYDQQTLHDVTAAYVDEPVFERQSDNRSDFEAEDQAAYQVDLETPVEMIDELPTRLVTESPVRGDVDEAAAAEQAVELPSWWRDDDEQDVQPETPLKATLSGHEVKLPEQFEDEYAFSEPAFPPLTSARERNDESEEFFGLAQLEPHEEIPLDRSLAVPAVLPPFAAEEEVAAEQFVNEDDELIGFGIESESVTSATDDVPDANHQAQAVGLELEHTPPESSATGKSPAVPIVLSNSDEDDSVEDYMRKLLARMRGVPEEEIEIAKPAPATAPTPAPSISATAGSKPTESLQSKPTPGPRTTVMAPKTAVDSIGSTEPFDPEKYVPRALAPERTTSLAAMRELANSSARTAIHKSTRQRHVTSILLKAVIAFVGLVVGLVLVAINGLNFNIGLVATLAAFLVAAIWGYDSLTSIRPMLQAGLVLEPRSNQREKPQSKEDI